MSEPSTNQDVGDLAEQTLGDFKLLRRLGRGGMAEVYLAEQKSLSRFVAIKVLLPETLRDSDDVPLKRFEQEAKAAGSINHPNIVQVYLIGEQKGLHYIVQEFVEGVNLSEYVKRHGPPGTTTGLKVMEHVAAALKTAGDAGIVHRDIKPENIMLTGNLSIPDAIATAKVTDFGLAQLGQSPEALNLTQRGTTMGTPLYMSPEQINGQKLDARSDIYSLGVTCYHMFAGRAPFRGETAMAVAAQHLNESPEPLTERRPDLPKSVCDLVDRMMQKAPEDRFADAATLLTAIAKAESAVADGHTDMSLSALGMPTMTSKQTKRSNRRELIAFVLSCLCVGGIAAAAGHFLKPTDPLSVPPVGTGQPALSREAQIGYAIARPEDKSAWRAVIKHHGDEPLEGGWARIQLGRLYLNDKRYNSAMDLFAEVQQFNSEESLKTMGRVGLAAVAVRTDEFDRAAELIESVQEDDVRGTVMQGWYREVTSQLRNRGEDRGRRE